jgi:GTPase
MADPSAPPPVRAKKPKSTFMLHDPVDFHPLGKFISTDYRYAALKTASRGVTKILLRKTNTKTIREFEGRIITLDTPKEIVRGNRTIVYAKKPAVKFVKSFLYAGPAVDGPEEEEATA